MLPPPSRYRLAVRRRAVSSGSSAMGDGLQSKIHSRQSGASAWTCTMLKRRWNARMRLLGGNSRSNAGANNQLSHHKDASAHCLRCLIANSCQADNDASTAAGLRSASEGICTLTARTGSVNPPASRIQAGVSMPFVVSYSSAPRRKILSEVCRHVQNARSKR